MIFFLHISLAIAGALMAKFWRLIRERAFKREGQLSLLGKLKAFFGFFDFFVWGLVGFICFLIAGNRAELLYLNDFVENFNLKFGVFSFLSGLIAEFLIIKASDLLNKKDFLTKQLFISPQGIKFKPHKLVSGKKADFYITVYHRGVVAIPPAGFGVKLYANGDEAGAAYAKELLLPGHSAELGPINWLVSKGRVVLKAKIIAYREKSDEKKDTREYKETGNSAERITSSRADRARLVLESVNIDPPYPQIGEAVRFSAIIKNIGEIDAPADCYTLKFFLGGSLIKEFFGSAIEPDGLVSLEAVLWKASAGEHFFKAVLIPHGHNSKVEYLNEFQERLIRIDSSDSLKISSLTAMVDGQAIKAPEELAVARGEKIRFIASLANSSGKNISTADYNLRFFGFNAVVKQGVANSGVTFEAVWVPRYSGYKEIGAILRARAGSSSVNVFSEKKTFIFKIVKGMKPEVEGLIKTSGILSAGKKINFLILLSNVGDLPLLAKDYYLLLKIDGEEFYVWKGEDISAKTYSFKLKVPSAWTAKKGEHLISAEINHKGKIITKFDEKITIKP